jgi:hypothetical protein
VVTCYFDHMHGAQSVMYHVILRTHIVVSRSLLNCASSSEQAVVNRLIALEPGNGLNVLALMFTN